MFQLAIYNNLYKYGREKESCWVKSLRLFYTPVTQSKAQRQGSIKEEAGVKKVLTVYQRVSKNTVIPKASQDQSTGSLISKVIPNSGGQGDSNSHKQDIKAR